MLLMGVHYQQIWRITCHAGAIYPTITNRNTHVQHQMKSYKNYGAEEFKIWRAETINQRQSKQKQKRRQKPRGQQSRTNNYATSLLLDNDGGTNLNGKVGLSKHHGTKH